MARIVRNKETSALYNDFDINGEELGSITEAEKQLDVVLKKQLNTSIDLRAQFAQHKTFVSPSIYKSLTELVQGTCTVAEFRELERNEEVRQELQRCGLSENEIDDYLKFKSGKETKNRLVNPSIFNERIHHIQEKIKAHHDNLTKPQTFNGIKRLTRHEMEIEKTLYAGCLKKNELASLISVENTADNSCTDETFSYIKDLSNKLLDKCQRRRKKRKHEVDNLTLLEKNEGSFVFDADVHHVVVPMEETDVSEKRLSIDEIRKLPRFENYQMGEPSKTLYLKNLHYKTTHHELRAIFSRFEKDGSSINYKLCTGKMKGQAFISLADAETAEKALQFANGFVLRGKPIIIEFGKKDGVNNNL